MDRENGEMIATAGGAWLSKHKELHINVLELEAIRRGLAVLLHDVSDAHILIQTDNVTAATYVNKMGVLILNRRF